MNDVIIRQCGIRKKEIKIFRIPFEMMLQHAIFNRNHQTYLLKVVSFFRITWMPEDVSVRSWVNDFILFTVINVN